LTIFNEAFLNSKSLIFIDSFYESSNKIISNRLFEVLKTINTKIIFTYNQGIKVPIVQKEINLTNPTKTEKEIIIKNILKREHMNLSSETINYISDQSNLSARETEGLIISIFAKKAQGDSTADI
jgi:chromosomal replication initiation ATPase DnaA